VGLTGLGPPDGQDPNVWLHGGGALFRVWLVLVNPFSTLFGDAAKVYLTKDLFFSGHVSSTFLLWLYCRREGRGLARAAALGHWATVAVVLLSHLHYTIDVVGAWAITYSLFALWGRPALPSSPRAEPAVELEVRGRKRYPCGLQPTWEVRMRRVTGIGGIFMSAQDPKALCDWYKKHLGIDVQSWGGAAFDWTDSEGNPTKGTTAWSIGPADGKHFAPSKSTFMVNYRVEDLDALLKALREEGCNVLEKTDDSEYGKFGWVMDPEGNKVELWQPPQGQ
jgi:predicted enzyme related to lactoylglutathione lyase